jgi:hypothetical protein
MHKVFSVLATFCLAISAGFLTGRLLAKPPVTVQFMPDQRPQVPVVQIDGVQNGLLQGFIFGNARVNIAGTTLVQSGAFTLDAAPLLQNEVLVNIPNGVHFVASKRGKKYYKVSSAAGARIIPSNRVYFRSETQAQSAGYLP